MEVEFINIMLLVDLKLLKIKKKLKIVIKNMYKVCNYTRVYSNLSNVKDFWLKVIMTLLFFQEEKKILKTVILENGYFKT